MPSIKRLLVVMGTIVALTVLAPVASAGTHKDFHLDKTCAEDSSEPLGYVCTVQHSDFKWIPAGTDIHYAAIPPLDPNLVVAATIEIRNGSTTGVCDWTHPVEEVLATCTFDTGTGRLTGFHLKVDVSADDPNDPESIWYWDGNYWFGGGH